MIECLSSSTGKLDVISAGSSYKAHGSANLSIYHVGCSQAQSCTLVT